MEASSTESIVDSLLPSPLQLQPGDADRDLDFDQLDLVRVLSADKYLTAEPATRGDGDWDAAPGGTPDDPPIGDGQFDQFDIVTALASAVYLTGPYAAFGSARSSTERLTYASPGDYDFENATLNPIAMPGKFDGSPGAHPVAPIPEPAGMAIITVLATCILSRRHRGQS